MTVREGFVLHYLKSPVCYSHKGETKEAVHLELREPGMQHGRHHFKLRQMLTRAMFEMSQVADELGVEKEDDSAGTEVKKLHETDEEAYQKETEDTVEAITLGISMASKVDLGEFVEVFGRMACMGKQGSVCLLDGVEPMTEPLWKRMNPLDAEAAAIRWAVFFAMPDALANKFSGKPSGSPSGVKEL